MPSSSLKPIRHCKSAVVLDFFFFFKESPECQPISSGCQLVNIFINKSKSLSSLSWGIKEKNIKKRKKAIKKQGKE